MPSLLEDMYLAAGKDGNLQLIRQCLHDKVDPNVRDALGNTIMHYVLTLGRRDIASLLLDHDVDEHIKNNVGQSAVDMAFDSKMAEWFIQCSRNKRLQQLFEAQRDIRGLKSDVAELKRRLMFYKPEVKSEHAAEPTFSAQASMNTESFIPSKM